MVCNRRAKTWHHPLNSASDHLGYREPVERLSVRVLGAFAVDGLDERAIGSRKARMLLKILACERGGPVSADRIAEALWADELPSKPADQISVLVSRLRSVLGGRIPRSDAGYNLRYDWLDLDELVERSREAAARLAAGQFGAARAASAAALRLMDGRILGDEDAAWADRVRTEIDRAVADARHTGARAALAVGACADAIGLGRAALDHDPYDEVALRLVMRAHTRLGRPGSALEIYAAFKARIVDAFGIGPTAETEQTHDEIVLGVDVGPVGGPPDADGHTMIGRDAELVSLDESLAAARHASRLVVITGEPGIGKSALIGSWARRAAHTGAHVLAGRCDQPGIGLPLQPVLDAVNEWLARVLGADPADALVRDDPVLGSVLGLRGAVRTLDVVGASTSVEEPDIGRRRLFAALIALLDAVRAGSPLVMIVEDVHQADSATVSWLVSFVRSVPNVLVVATSRDARHALGEATTLALGPLSAETAARLIGDRAAAQIYGRSGGNPLFLLELAQVADGALPDSVVEAVERRSVMLGPAASTIRIAALLGLDIDLDLLTACCRRPVAEVLDHVSVAVAQHMVVDGVGGLRFRHDVVREALVAGTTESVRAFVHREAALQLTSRPDHSPLDAAHHAERGGRDEIAADAFVDGAQIALDRFEADLAEELLDRAIALADSSHARTARARVHLTQRNFNAAHDDLVVALRGDRSPSALELGGWIAYYRRDYVHARAFACEALATTASPELRSSAAALEGRIRHSQGDLTGALVCLQSAIDGATDSTSHRTSGVAQVWLSSVLTHQGRVTEALETLDRAGDPTTLRSHPFVAAHAWFTRCLAAGIAGDLGAAFRAADALGDHAQNTGVAGVRFAPLALNIRSWLERSVGNLDDASELSARALLTAERAAFDEPASHARLDQVELLMIHRRRADASLALDQATLRLAPMSTMAWHQQQRVMLLSGRLALLMGHPDRAAEFATRLGDDARERTSERYGVLAWQLRLVAAGAVGRPVDVSELGELLSAIDRVAALDGWRLIAELAAATGLASLWSEAESRARALSERTRDVPHLEQRVVDAWLSSTMDEFRRRS